MFKCGKKLNKKQKQRVLALVLSLWYIYTLAYLASPEKKSSCIILFPDWVEQQWPPIDSQTPGVNVIKKFPSSPTTGPYKLEDLSL